jgi:predicted nicotinamide N-methyase
VDTVVERIVVAGLDLEIERPPDAERLIDECAFERDEYLPYWAELWPSGVAMAHHVAALDPAGARVVELGCGLALPSLVAAALGANVTALDWSPDAIRQLRTNAERNRLTVDAVVADWRDPQPVAAQRFDVVLAADVLYEERNAAPLLDLLPRLLATRGTAYVADPGRRHARPFLDAVAGAGWTVDAIADPRIPHGAIHVVRGAGLRQV